VSTSRNAAASGDFLVEPSGIALRDAEPRSGEGNRQPVRIYGSLAFVKVRGGSVQTGN
jgi:hypothetical protein